jgi:ribosome maturation factor RimP
MVLVELTLSRHKSSVQIRAVVCRAGPSPENPGKVSGGAMGVNDCSRVHHALLPRLELAFPGQELYVEVSSPGIDRVIKDASEFVYYIGRGVRCYCTELSDWVEGAIRSADETQLILKGKDGMIKIAYETIAKAKLEYSLDYLREV